MNVPQLLYPFICRWTSRLLPRTGLFEDKHLCLFPGKHGLIKAFVFNDGLLERAFRSCAQFLQSHKTLCSSMDCSLPGSSVHGIFQVRILEWFLFPSPLDHMSSQSVGPLASSIGITGELVKDANSQPRSTELEMPGVKPRKLWF